MEIVAAVSSVVGIVGFAGQAITGITNLRNLFQGCASASRSIDRFLRDLNSLLQTLENVKTVVANFETSCSLADSSFASLKIQLEDCAKDVFLWRQEAAAMHPGFRSGTKATFKKFLVAVTKDDYNDIYRDIANHKHNLTTTLSIIGRLLLFSCNSSYHI
jgi:hypothetical protein